MKNILYIGPFTSASGWGQCAIAMARSMKEVGLDFAMYDFKLDQTSQSIPDDLSENFNAKLEKTDFIIQNTLPEYFYYDSRFKKNIGKFVFETDLSMSSWPIHAQFMDQCWVTTNEEAKLFNHPNVHAIGEAIDVSIADKRYEPVNEIQITGNDYTFYTIAEFNERKNLETLIRGYLEEFTCYDSVALVIKTSDPKVEELAVKIRSSMRIYNIDYMYPQIFVIPHFLSEEDINRLHYEANCFVCTSRGESFCRPAAEAAVFGNQVIYTDQIGIQEYMTTSGRRIDSQKESCLVANPPMPHLYTSSESWYNPSTSSLKKHMRQAYQNREVCYDPELVREAVCYKTIGENIKKCLDL